MIVNGENGKNHQKNRIFYGWYIVAGAWIIQCLNGGLFFNAFQCFLLFFTVFKGFYVFLLFLKVF